MRSDNERLKMLTVWHIYLFLMSYAATCVLKTLRLSFRTVSPEDCIVTHLWVNLIFNRVIHLIVSKDSVVDNEIFTQLFDAYRLVNHFCVSRSTWYLPVYLT